MKSFLLASCLCFFVPLCMAQTIDIDAWIWNVSSSGDIELTGDLGDQLDLGEDLSIGEEWTPGATLIFGEGPFQIGASVFQLDLGGTEQIEQSISFGGLNFNASADATTSLEMLVARGFLRFQLGEEAVSFALEGGGTYVDLDAKASAFEVFSTGAESQVALPYVGAEIRVEPIPSTSTRPGRRWSSPRNGNPPRRSPSAPATGAWPSCWTRRKRRSPATWCSTAPRSTPDSNGRSPS